MSFNKYPSSSNPEGPPSGEFLFENLDLYGVYDALERQGYKETDAQFSVTQFEPNKPIRIDLVNPLEKDRVVVSEPSDEEGEHAVRRMFGEHATLDNIHRGMSAAVYRIPRGSRLLSATLRSGPYENDYMRNLGARAFRFIDKVNAINPRLKVTVDDVALTHNGIEDDDVYMTLLPPTPRLSGDVPSYLQRTNRPSSPKEIKEYEKRLERDEISIEIDPERLIMNYFKKRKGEE